jgi:N-acetyl sugar amidotransferase
MTNQRPSSTPEFKHNVNSKKVTLHIDEDGVCDACRFAELKEQIDWKSREKELQILCDKYRKNDGSYDCIIPGSGGKDSAYAAHIMKYKYNMNPLTVTWPPILYTDYGYENFKNWVEIGGFDNITFKPNGKVQKLLTKLSIENLFHPFQTFILGQKNIATKIAAKYGIELIFYGENEAEYGNPISDNSSSFRSDDYFSIDNLKEVYLGGVSVDSLIKNYNLSLNDLEPYLPLRKEEVWNKNIKVHYLGYYLKWLPQEAYYYAVQNTGFKARPFRTQGTYSKYNSIDDKIDDLHYYTTYIKFGLGRASYDASQEIRNKHITREEGITLVNKFDGEFPDKYFNEIMEYLDIDPDYFINELTDKFRPSHLWEKVNGNWKMKHTVNRK